MNFKELIINWIVENNWLVYFILGGVFIYFVWLKPELNDVRVKNKLISNDAENEKIKEFVKSVKKCSYKKRTILLILLSISLSITIMFWVTFEGKSINNLYDVIKIAIPISTVYLLLSGLKKSDSDDKKAKVDLDIVINLKIKILNQLVLDEKKMYSEALTKKVCEWHTKDKSDILFASLIMRMIDKSFVEMLKNACHIYSDEDKLEGASKVVLYEKPQEIIESYCNGDKKMNVLSNILDLFSGYFKLKNSDIYKLMFFISIHEQSCKNKTREEIMDEIRYMVNDKSDSYKEKEELSPKGLDDMLNTQGDNKKYIEK